jgi:hypothetical protein
LIFVPEHLGCAADGHLACQFWLNSGGATMVSRAPRLLSNLKQRRRFGGHPIRWL